MMVVRGNGRVRSVCKSYVQGAVASHVSKQLMRTACRMLCQQACIAPIAAEHDMLCASHCRGCQTHVPLVPQKCRCEKISHQYPSSLFDDVMIVH